MPVTHEFVEQYVGLLDETRPQKTKTAIHMVQIVIQGETVDPELMLATELAYKQLYPNDTIHFKVYAFIRENQHWWVMDNASHPHSNMCAWGRKLAAAHNLSLADITYDSEMLHFTFNDQPKLQNVTRQLHEAAKQSDFIKAPYAVGEFELNTDLDDEPGQTTYTMVFYRPEEA